MLEKDEIDLAVVQARLEQHLDELNDVAYERRIVKHCRRIVNRHLGLKRPTILHSINITQHADFDEMLDAAERRRRHHRRPNLRAGRRRHHSRRRRRRWTNRLRRY